jgi:NADH:ubiquinone oxidoreductase subunit 2 (subunit N)
MRNKEENSRFSAKNSNKTKLYICSLLFMLIAFSFVYIAIYFQDKHPDISYFINIISIILVVIVCWNLGNNLPKMSDKPGTQFLRYVISSVILLPLLLYTLIEFIAEALKNDKEFVYLLIFLLCGICAAICIYYYLKKILNLYKNWRKQEPSAQFWDLLSNWKDL